MINVLPFVFNHLVGALDKIVGLNGFLGAKMIAVITALAVACKVDNGFAQGFAGDCAGIQAGPARKGVVVDDCNFGAELCRANGGLLSRWAGTDDNQIVIILVARKADEFLRDFELVVGLGL